MFKEIEIKKLTASKENYRAAINAETLKDLAGSIKSKGILQPIIVREAKGKDKFEIVAGHRRFEAAKSVKLKKIPSMVMPLTDEEALEFQITENSQREDPNIMEQAHGFKKLLDMGKHNTKTLAAKIDHSERYVLHRLKLLNIPKEAQEKVAKGEMPIGLALLLSRLNTPAEQKEFYEEIQAHYSETGFTTTESALRILDDYILSMKTAPFDTAECAKCEFRSRNQVTLFPELKKDNDNCLDRACFIEKSKVFYKAKLAKKKKAGFPTLELKEEKFPKGSCKITAPVKYDTNDEQPRLYKSECMKCTENHAWFFVDNKNHLSFGELCLNTKCLKKMNTPKPTSNSVEATDDKSTAPSVAVFDNPQKTVECRDRFILSNMPMRVEGSEVLQKRLILLSVICCIETDHREEVFKIAYPGTKDIYMPFAIEFLEEIKKIPAKKLDEVIERAIIESAVHIEGDVLTALIEEAGIKLSNEVVVDEEYLKAMTKNQLTDFIKEMKITPIFGEGMSPAKKGDTITAILADDLQGKMPPTLAKSFECE